MENTTQHISYLWKQFIDGNANLEEIEALLAYFRQSNLEDKDIDLFSSYLKTLPIPEKENEGYWAEKLKGILQFPHTNEGLNSPVGLTADLQSVPINTSAESSALLDSSAVQRVHFLRKTWFRYAAVLLLVAGTASLLYKINRPQKELISAAKQDTSPIIPGGDRATLTLADGSIMLLDSAVNGALVDQGSSKVIKLASGSLVYEASSAIAATGYNTISTPKGGQYQVVLPDGSRVWLNAASSIRFPVDAGKVERELVVTGEVYIKVKQDAKRPFHVKTGEIDVEVLGTSFNLNAYQEEGAIRATLIEGAIRLNNTAQSSVLLNPGQQGVLISGNARISVEAPDLDEVLAWKNGLFKFNNTNIDVVLRQVARWYDLDIVYEGDHPADKFGGEIPRKVSAATILEMITASGVKLRREGRKVIVL